LVGIEPTSMTAVFCRNATDRTAETWSNQLEPFVALEFVVSDAARGITAAVQQLAEARRRDPAAPGLEHGLDVFHTAMEAKRVLARHWRRAEAAWERAEAADEKVAASKRQGVDARGVAQAARATWREATTRFEQVERLEAAWGRIAAALEVFRADGRLNDRANGQAEIAAALGDLPGPEWSKLRNFLSDPRSLAFLDRLHRRLEAAEPCPAWRAAMAWRWWLRRGRAEPAADRPIAMLRAVARRRELDESEQARYARVAAVLETTVRASSAVECLNGVLRMPQSRPKRMSQAMLDLKRLYWNSHALRSGPRKDVCPYRALGLELPTYDFWGLLQAAPARLTQELSTQGNEE
jgi:hypothetical protein